MEIIEKARYLAITAHAGQSYGKDIHVPYIKHLEDVVKVLNEFGIVDDNLIIAGYLHDIIEDTFATYSDLKKSTNEIIAEYTFALTNEKGRNRVDRANDKYYKELKEYKHGSFIKLCDRIANVKYSKNINPEMFKMYKKEYKNFKEKLYDGRWNPMWKELEKLIKE